MTRMKREQISWLLFAFALLLLLSGCEDDPVFSRPWRPPAFTIKSKTQVKLDKPTFKFDYSSVGKRDPFRPPYLSADRIKAGGGDDSKSQNQTDSVKKSTRPKTLLERFLLQQLSVVAVITGVSNPIAMVRTPTGQGHVVRRGTLIGTNGGRISRIFPGGVVVSEVYRDPRTRSLRVARKIIRIQGNKRGSLRRQFSIGGKKVYVDAQGRVREVPSAAAAAGSNSPADDNQRSVKTLRRKTDRLFRARTGGN